MTPQEFRKFCSDIKNLPALPRPRRSRFAPAPTGLLHQGHILSAIWTWGLAAIQGAEVWLRIEDHDRSRSRPQFRDRLIADLSWLGLIDSDTPIVDQSSREDRYLHAAKQLSTYFCTCSRREIQERRQRSALANADTELRYDGHCRTASHADGTDRTWRWCLPSAVASFDDLRHGPVTHTPSNQCGDFALRDRHGQWTYQFAVTVDDFDQNMSLITRGDDILASTGRQILLGEALGRTQQPTWCHHPLIMDQTGRKLSKRDGDLGIEVLRKTYDATSLLAHTAVLGGLIARVDDWPAGGITALFAGH